MQDRLDQAMRWAETCGLHIDDVDLPYLHELNYLTLAGISIRQNRAAETIDLLDRLLKNAESNARTSRVIEILALRALALHAQGDAKAASVALERALGLAETEGYVRIFVDKGEAMKLRIADLRSLNADLRLQSYMGKLLAAFTTPGDDAPAQSKIGHPQSKIANRTSAMIEQLSVRELEVLRLIADGLSNHEIAARLVISAGTVKTHINNIFGKLDVKSRTQAVAHARDLGLL